MNRQAMSRSKRIVAAVPPSRRGALCLPSRDRHFFVLAGIIAIWVSIAAGQAYATPFKLYASWFQSPKNFYSIDPSTGAATVIATTSSFDPGLAFRRSNGVLYGSSSNLDRINVKTGLATTIASLPDLMVGIAFSPADQLYAVNNGSSSSKTLYTLDPATGSALAGVTISGTVFAGSGAPFPGEISGISFSPSGTLYGIGAGLYSINPLTGVATRITPAGKNVDAVNEIFRNIDFGFDGILRGITYANGNPSSHLYTINPLTGLGTLVGATGFSMDGLASVPVPEPSALTLAALGVLCLGALRWRYATG